MKTIGNCVIIYRVVGNSGPFVSNWVLEKKQAKEIMDTQEGYIILDTRAQDEYDESHIPGAILIPHDQILAKAESVLTDKDQLILVYCRSGNRSKQASEKLVALGYTNVVEFGGIIDWPYEIVK